MKEQEIYNHQLAIRYFEGRITPSEEEILFRFVNDAPSNERMFRQWEEEWMLSYKLIPEVSNEWKQLQRRMQVRQSLQLHVFYYWVEHIVSIFIGIRKLPITGLL